MKRILIIITLIIIIMFCSTIPVAAAPPEIINYTLGGGGVGALSYGCTLNDANLRVETLWIINNSPHTRYLKLIDHGEIVYELVSPANSGYIEEMIDVSYKFMRTPANDPDEPLHIRRLPNTEICCDYVP